MSASLEDLFGGQPPGEPDRDEGELRRALVIAAHPDDADFGAGGTAALLAGAGWEVRYLVVTDGSKGSDDPAFTPETLVAAREHEQREAARILGVGSVVFLGYTDGELVYSRELLGAVTREIRAFQPFAVYTHDPEPVIISNSFVNHNDHRISGLAAVDAVYPTARDRLNFPEQIEGGLPTPQGARALPLGRERADRRGRHLERGRYEDRGADGARQPVRRARGLRRDGARALARGGRPLPRALPPRRPLPLTAR